MYKLADFIKNYNYHSEKDFLNEFPAPFLLVEKQQKSTVNEGGKTSILGSFNTLKDIEKQHITSFYGKRPGNVPVALSLVFNFSEALEKHSFLISVGRSASSFIYLKDASISKFHAYFKSDSNNNWLVADANSSNGSRLNGKIMQPNEEHLLKDHDGILLSKIYLCSFFFPQCFYEYVQWLGSENLLLASK